MLPVCEGRRNFGYQPVVVLNDSIAALLFRHRWFDRSQKGPTWAIGRKGNPWHFTGMERSSTIEVAGADHEGGGLTSASSNLAGSDKVIWLEEEDLSSLAKMRRLPGCLGRYVRSCFSHSGIRELWRLSTRPCWWRLNSIMTTLRKDKPFLETMEVGEVQSRWIDGK